MRSVLDSWIRYRERVLEHATPEQTRSAWIAYYNGAAAVLHEIQVASQGADSRAMSKLSDLYEEIDAQASLYEVILKRQSWDEVEIP